MQPVAARNRGEWLLLGAVALLPLASCPWLATHSLAKAVWLWLAVGLGLLAVALRRRPARPPAAADGLGRFAPRLFLLAFLGSLVAFGVRSADLLGGAERLLVDAAVLLAAWGLRGRGPAGEQRLLHAWVGGAAVAAGVQLGARLVGAEAGQEPPYGNAMVAGMHAAVALPGAMALWFGAPATAHWRRRLGYGASALLLAALGLSGSFGGLVAAFGGVVAAWVVAAGPGRRLRRAAPALLAAGLVAGSLALVPTLRHEAADHGARRVYVWRVSARAVAAAPLGGHGPGDFARAFLDAQGETLAAAPAARRYWTHADKAHQVLLGRAVEAGLPAALALLGACGALAWAVRRRPGLFGTTVAWLLTGCYGFPLEAPATAGLFGLLLAAAARPDAVPAPTDPAAPATPTGAGRGARWAALARLRRLGGRAVLALVGLAFLGFAGLRAAGDGLRVAGRPDVAQTLVPRDAQALSMLAGAALRAGAPGRAYALYLVAGALRANLTTRLMTGNACYALKQWDRALAHYRAAIAWHPRYSLAYHNAARAALAAGRRAEAERLSLRAASLNPSHPKIRALHDCLKHPRRPCGP